MSAATIKPEVIREQKINLTVYQVGSFPDGVDGISAPDDKGGFMILINADQTPEEQARTFLHEMLHIWRGIMTGLRLKVSRRLRAKRS